MSIKPPAAKKWKWLLVLPAGIGGGIAASLLYGIFYLVNNYLSSPLDDIPSEWVEIITSALWGYFFVYAGTKTAPNHRSIVGIVLAVIFVIFEGFVAKSFFANKDENTGWFLFCTLIALAGAITAAVKGYRKGDE